MRTLIAILLLACAAPASAEQQLIPYSPSGDAGAIILSAPPSYRHQQLIPDPYPNSLGPNALGNARPTHVQRHQTLVPSPYPRSLGANAMGDPAPTRVRRHQRLIKSPYPNRYR